jgi:hypothetical protein
MKKPYLVYACDSHRHLVCIPYSIKNLHQMAAELGIKRCWFHKDHYDIPKRRIAEITNRCRFVLSTRVMVDLFDLRRKRRA